MIAVIASPVVGQGGKDMGRNGRVAVVSLCSGNEGSLAWLGKWSEGSRVTGWFPGQGSFSVYPGHTETDYL